MLHGSLDPATGRPSPRCDLVGARKRAAYRVKLALDKARRQAAEQLCQQSIQAELLRRKQQSEKHRPANRAPEARPAPVPDYDSERQYNAAARTILAALPGAKCGSLC